MNPNYYNILVSPIDGSWTDSFVRQWAIERHAETNHKYDGYLPYEFHLRMVRHTALRYIHLIPVNDQITVLAGCWVHDVIEDARQSYNDVKKATNEQIADLAYALTNKRGKTRSERADDEYYALIRNTPYATFIKLCDRIANMEYGKMIGGHKMFEQYADEYPAFIKRLEDDKYREMFSHIHIMISQYKQEQLKPKKQKQ